MIYCKVIPVCSEYTLQTEDISFFGLCKQYLYDHLSTRLFSSIFKSHVPNLVIMIAAPLLLFLKLFLHLPEYARWGFMSSRLFPELVRELEEISGLHVPVNFTGGLIPVLGAEDFQKRADYIVKLREALGEYRGAVIERGELEKKLPKIPFGPEVCGAAWCEEDGVIDPLALLRAYRAALPRLGAEYVETLVLDVTPHASGYRVATRNRDYFCRRLVLAAGLANRRFARFAVPDRSARGSGLHRLQGQGLSKPPPGGEAWTKKRRQENPENATSSSWAAAFPARPWLSDWPEKAARSRCWTRPPAPTWPRAPMWG